VPPDRIVALTAPAGTTETELRLDHQAALAEDYHRVILVTSPPHTRRVKLIWSRQSPGHLEAIVRAAKSEDFTMEEWWHKRRAAEILLHEYLGILAFLLGVSSLMR
jgi:uncharacterized SAM-binding protein YcdF (DUF218 family)